MKALMIMAFVLFQTSLLASEIAMEPFNPVDCEKGFKNELARVSTPRLIEEDDHVTITFMAWTGTCQEAFTLDHSKSIVATKYGFNAKRRGITLKSERLGEQVDRISISIPYERFYKKDSLKLRYRFIPNIYGKRTYDWYLKVNHHEEEGFTASFR